MLETLGSVASIAGLIVAVVGFVIAIVQIRRSRSAAEAAREAAEAAREGIASQLTAGDLARARDRMQTIKDLHQTSEWPRALDRYAEVRQMLIAIRVRYPELSDARRRTLQNATAQFGIMEDEVRRALQETREPDIGRFERFISETQDTLDELGAQLRQAG